MNDNKQKEIELARTTAMSGGFKEYIKPATQLMIAWDKDFDMTGVSVSQPDKKNGSPKTGDMIAVNKEDNTDKWLVAKAFFDANYKLKSGNTKSLANTDTNTAKSNVRDIVFWGNGDTFKLISKASSETEGWMKSTKAMQAGKDVVIQVTTQQRNPDGSYVVAEALTTVENVQILNVFDDEGNITGRFIGRP